MYELIISQIWNKVKQKLISNYERNLKMLKNKKKRLLFVGTTFAISILALFFVIINFRDNIVFFYSPSE